MSKFMKIENIALNDTVVKYNDKIYVLKRYQPHPQSYSGGPAFLISPTKKQDEPPLHVSGDTIVEMLYSPMEAANLVAKALSLNPVNNYATILVLAGKYEDGTVYFLMDDDQLLSPKQALHHLQFFIDNRIPEQYCSWTMTDDPDAYITTCGYSSNGIFPDVPFIDFCPYCGRKIKIK